MAYFSDLSFYTYSNGDNARGTKNVGWLHAGHEFEKMAPTEETLDLLWSFCAVAVMPSRGGHPCDLCAPLQTVKTTRNGVNLLLGTSEIRVFSRKGDALTLRQRLREAESSGLIFFQRSNVPYDVYAAPSLIYHYVHAHHYKPPDEFLRALKDGPRPPDPEYFENLRELELEWATAH